MTAVLEAVAPFVVLLIAAACLPLFAGDYWVVIATRACIYWVLVSGLNLVVGFAGQIAIGWVALLTLGAYTTSVLAAGTVTPALSPFITLAIAAVAGAIFGLIIGLPALRLRTFYFAMTTLGFATIITQVALAWQSVTGGGVGVAGPVFPGPFSTQWGLYYFSLGLAAICTWMTANLAASRFGRALVAIRDAEVAAEANGIFKPPLLVMVFLFSGAVAAVAGGLFASLQSYITPDAFTFDLSVLFFIAILIGGRGSILGPLLGTILLTVLPEFAAPLVAWSTFLYAALLLLIVLAIPGGIAELLDFRNRRPLVRHREILPSPELLPTILDRTTEAGTLAVEARVAQLRRPAGDRPAGPDAARRTGARADRSQRQRQDHHTECHLRLLCPAGRRRAAERGGAAGAGAAYPRTPSDCPHLSDTARGRRRIRAAERGAGRYGGRTRQLRRSDAVAAPALAGRAGVAAVGDAGAGRGRPGPACRRARRPLAAQRASLHGDRPRPDAAPGFPATG